MVEGLLSWYLLSALMTDANGHRWSQILRDVRVHHLHMIMLRNTTMFFRCYKESIFVEVIMGIEDSDCQLLVGHQIIGSSVW